MHAANHPALPAADTKLPSTLDLAFDFGSRRLGGRELIFLLLAFVLHLTISLVVDGAPTSTQETTLVTEVELPPPPEPEKVAEPDPPPDEPAPAVRQAATPPPQAARAAALVTAKDNAPAKTDEPVDFVTDPNGSTFGSGIVARGGTADRGERGATAQGVGAAPAPASRPSDGLVAPENLSRRASLSEADACAGFYPSEADADSGAVTLTLVVRADGAVTSSSVLAETPAGQGFGKAARECLRTKRFQPSLDRAGNAVAAATTIKLRFVR